VSLPRGRKPRGTWVPHLTASVGRVGCHCPEGQAEQQKGDGPHGHAESEGRHTGQAKLAGSSTTNATLARARVTATYRWQAGSVPNALPVSKNSRMAAVGAIKTRSASSPLAIPILMKSRSSARKVVLVEGPSDAIVFTRCFKDVTGTSPMEAGVGVISMNGLTFRRALELCNSLDREVVALRDNDDADPDELRADLGDLPVDLGLTSRTGCHRPAARSSLRSTL
jgi:hypothetical protein